MFVTNKVCGKVNETISKCVWWFVYCKWLNFIKFAVGGRAIKVFAFLSHLLQSFPQQTSL